MIPLCVEAYVSVSNYLKVVWTTQSALSLFSKEHLVTHCCIKQYLWESLWCCISFILFHLVQPHKSGQAVIK